MKLNDRLKKLELIQPNKERWIVVRYPAELVQLSCGGVKYDKLAYETEYEFIKRVKKSVMYEPTRKYPIILVGNF